MEIAKKPRRTTPRSGSRSGRRSASGSSGSSASKGTPRVPILAPDFLDLITEFAAAGVRYLLVGGYAVGFHGRPRATKDLDLWIDPTPANAARVLRALRAFGAPLAQLSARDLAVPGKFFVMGRPPNRVDLLTETPELVFRDAWKRRVSCELTRSLRCPVIGLDDLIRTKSAAGRPRDIADVKDLERARGRKPRRGGM